ncbi:MAG: hypothetical protein LLG00_00660 [Planctomycetaceae bacterium]|nr:hypothetical protein [Planctomycetaceae bacterium]
MTPELLAEESLRKALLERPSATAPEAGTLRDFLGAYVGAVEGTGEALSEDCGRRFADAVALERQQGRP